MKEKENLLLLLSFFSFFLSVIELSSFVRMVLSADNAHLQPFLDGVQRAQAHLAIWTQVILDPNRSQLHDFAKEQIYAANEFLSRAQKALASAQEK